MSNTIKTINIVEVSRHGGVESIVSYDANYHNTAEQDFEKLARQEYPHYNDEEIDSVLDDGYFDKVSGNTVCLTHSS